MTRSLFCLTPVALALALALGVAAPSPALAQTAEQSSPNSLVAVGERWRQLYEAGDWETLRTLYTDDAVLMSQGQPKIEGADAILAFLQRLSEQGATVTFQFAPEHAVIENGLGFMIAKYRMDVAFAGGETVTVAGRSMLVYKWQDGRDGSGWRIWRDIDNFAPDAVPEDFETRGAK